MKIKIIENNVRGKRLIVGKKCKSKIHKIREQNKVVSEREGNNERIKKM